VQSVLGHYRILEKLGAGGMGEVYLAEDSKLGRKIALKVLPPELAASPERLSRFEGEAKAVAALNHPNIVTVYSVEEADGVPFITMELVQGKTLKVAIRRTTLREFFGIAIPLADALSAAHQEGIVHRDLKPDNVMVTDEGRVKILDFGLAKVRAKPGIGSDSFAASHLPTKSVTTPGVIVGTVAYMSPEQAEGKGVDARSDIFSLGIILYELLAGRHPFSGDSAASVLSGILKDTPPLLSELDPRVPHELTRIVRRCLEKGLTSRYQSALDLKNDLEEVKADFDSGAIQRRVLPRKSRSLVPAALSALLLGLAGLMTIVWTSSRSDGPRPLTRSVIPISSADSLAVESATNPIAISPDGRFVVFSGSRAGIERFYLRALDGQEAEPIDGTEGGRSPFFSPDGRWLGFQRKDELKKISLTGGAPLTICSGCGGMGSSWSSDDAIVSGGGRLGIRSVSVTSGDERTLTAADKERGERSLRFPEVLPGGKAVIFTAGGWEDATFDDARIEVVSIPTGAKKVLIEGGSHARYAPTGHLIYGRAGALFAVPFDLDSLEVTGGPVEVLEGVATDPRNGAAYFAMSPAGTLVYAPGGAMGVHHRLVWVDREGRIEPAAEITAALDSPRLSSDGGRIALRVEGALGHLAVYDLPRGTLTRLTFEENVPSRGVWTPDGTRLTYTWQRSGTPGLFWQSANGSGPAEELGQEGFAGSWSADGGVLAFVRSGASSQQDIWLLPITGDRTPRPLIEERFNQFEPEISPDGRWLAYVSDESGGTEVYVREFPGLGQKTQISRNGGFEPRWSRDGRELFYIEGEDKLMFSRIKVQPTFAATRAAIAFEDKEHRYLKLGYDVSRDGRFLLVDENESRPRQLTLVQNWFSELERLVPTR
jgi:serine/threonine-protein kinase